jgi:hypothetical protein
MHSKLVVTLSADNFTHHAHIKSLIKESVERWHFLTRNLSKQHLK